MSNILESRTTYKPIHYDWAYSIFLEHEKMHWTSEEVALQEDVKDWKQVLTEEEKNLIRNIILLFTQADTDVASGYYDKIMPIFKHPELRMMMGSFANREATHMDAYALLTETLGFDDEIYTEFKEYEAMAEKHNFVRNFEPTNSVQDIAMTLAIYSAFTEGLALFSSFAMLLNFQRFKKMKNMGIVVEWSIKDETKHVEGMLKVFRTLMAENPHLWTDDFQKTFYDTAREMVEMEDAFIDLAFEMGGIEGLTCDDMKKYIRYICDRRLLQLGLKTNYGVKDNPLPWIDELLGTVVHTNFFEARSTEYSKGGVKGSFQTLDFPKVN